MPNCSNCGGYTSMEDIDARYARNHEECTCIRCGNCDEVIGDTIEPAWWNDSQEREHYALNHLDLVLPEPEEL